MIHSLLFCGGVFCYLTRGQIFLHLKYLYCPQQVSWQLKKSCEKWKLDQAYAIRLKIGKMFILPLGVIQP